MIFLNIFWFVLIKYVNTSKTIGARKLNYISLESSLKVVQDRENSKPQEQYLRSHNKFGVFKNNKVFKKMQKSLKVLELASFA